MAERSARMGSVRYTRTLFLCALCIWLCFGYSVAYAQSPSPSPQVSDIDIQISEKQQEIASINKKIAELDAKRAHTVAEAEAIELTLEKLKSELVRAQAQLEKTKATIKKVENDQVVTEKKSQQLEGELEERRKQLSSLVRQLYQFEQLSLVRIFFDSKSLSDVLLVRRTYEQLQERSLTVMKDVRAKKEQLNEQQRQLEQQAEDLGELQTLLDAQAKDIVDRRAVQKDFLQEKEQKKAQFEGLIAEARAAREEIQKQVFTLQSGKVNVSLKTAIDMAKFAGSVTGVRPALIMAVLKVESNVGTNLGSGVFPDDMHPQSRDAFLRITKKLGIDPTKAQISRRPRNMKGWGGAMGPAQILPATWEGIENRIMQLTKKPLVNPYELSDAFVATAIFLADRGATTRAGEYEAVNRYIAGPNWQYYTWYGDKVMAVAKEYESQGL